MAVQGSGKRKIEVRRTSSEAADDLNGTLVHFKDNGPLAKSVALGHGFQAAAGQVLSSQRVEQSANAPCTAHPHISISCLFTIYSCGSRRL